MSGYAEGGYVPGEVEIKVLRGPRREAVDPDLLSLYEDECIVNRNAVCTRKDPGHASIPIPSNRTWFCPAHGDPS